MALTQFNQWEPTLAGLEGNMMAQPRVFSHDAVAVVVGAINFSDSSKGLTITSAGTGFVVGEVITYAAGSAAGTGLVLTVTAIDGGAVTDFDVTTAGSLYDIGESLTFTTSGAGASFTVDVLNIDIPNTQVRGCCIYVGASAGIPSLSVVMESGNTAVFKTISAGSILPILIKRITTPLAANDVIALF